MTENNEIKRDLREYEVLKDCARPDIYRINAFRVTGLPVDSGSMDISRQFDKIKMARQFGVSVGLNLGILPLDPQPNDDDLRNAMQRMHDPERRLVDELFWFWPQQLGKGKDDEILKTLANGEIEKALELWLEHESYTDSNVSMHNNAVLYHTRALDLELLGKSGLLSNEQLMERDVCWVEALLRWRALINYEYFWDRLKSRVHDYGDPRLTSDIIQRLREYLPTALLIINARLAASATESGCLQDAERHLLIIRESGFVEKASFKAIKCAVEPYVSRIRILSKTTEEELSSKPLEALTTIRTYFDNVRPLLNVVECLLEKNDSVYEGIHDEIVKCAMGAIFANANTVKDWKACLELIEEISVYGVSSATKDRLGELKQILQGNLDYKIKYETCYFCNKNTPQAECACEVKMYGDVAKLQSQITWRVLNVKVPRCKICNNIHDQAMVYNVLGLASGAGVGVLLLLMMYTSGNYKNGSEEAMWMVFIFSVVAGLIVGSLKFNSRVKKIGSMQQWRRVNFQDVLEMKEKGWLVGERPPNVQQ